jgi:hypothetical protein
MSFDTQPPHMLTIDEIWAAKDIEERVVPVPQWGGAVKIRTLSQKQSADLRRKAQRINPVTKQSELDNEALEQLLFIEGVIEPQFSITDYGRLSEKSMAAVTTVLKAIMDASGFSGESVNEATKSPVEGSLAAVRVHTGEDAGDDEG